MSAPQSASPLDRLWTAFRALVRAELPSLTFLGIYEYAVQDVHGSPPNCTVDCSPTDTSLPLPALSGIAMRSSVGGVACKPTKGNRCLVLFLNGDPTKPVIFGTDPDVVQMNLSASSSVNIAGGGMAASEHVATVEAVVNMFTNFLFLLLSQGDISTWTNAGKIFYTLEGVPGTLLQTALNNMMDGCALTSLPITTGPTHGGLLFPLVYAKILSTLGAKPSDASGLLPGMGAPNVRTG